MEDLGRGIATVGIWISVALVMIFGHLPSDTQIGMCIGASSATGLIWFVG